MAVSETTVPVETLEGLDVEEGDLLTVTRKGDGVVTLASMKHHGTVQMTCSQFVEKWGGIFDEKDLTEKAKNDPRLAHILEKHVR